MKKAVILVFGALLLATTVNCTKRPVKPVRQPGAQTQDQSVTGSGRPLSGGVNLADATRKFFKNTFSGFQGFGKPVKLDRNSALMGMALIGTVILGFLVYYQNRPQKAPRQGGRSPARKGRYQI